MPRAVVARVVLVPSPRPLATLDYRVPPSLDVPTAGMRVLVPLGPRRRMGVVMSVQHAEKPDERLRDVISVLDREPVLDSTLLELVGWMADYYVAPLSEAVATALPGALRVETERVVEVSEGGVAGEIDGPDGAVFAWLADRGEASLSMLQRHLGAAARPAVGRLQRRGVVRVVERLRREITPTRHVSLFAAAHVVGDDDSRLTRRPALARVYGYLRDHPRGEAPGDELKRLFSNVNEKLRRLTEIGLIQSRSEERYRKVLPPRSEESTPHPTLSDSQRSAVARTTAAGLGFHPMLLWGVTGSGKTEVYLRTAAAIRAEGRTALFLVPEISLTHQLVQRVRARFGEQVAILHSQLSDGERWDEWRRIARGEAGLVIGARSAVFAPLPRLGLIVVDEEHDASYKQSDGVRYQGRDVAVMRAKLTGCTLLLGSATPSMESFANAREGRYELLELPERVTVRTLPEVRLVDVRTKPLVPASPLSPLLNAAIEANLAVAGQTLLFLNRRGFANFLQCVACGEPVVCPNCSVSLTSHRGARALRCHYCDHTASPPRICGGCGEPGLRAWGVGTEQLEMLLRELFPEARVARMDKDTTGRKGSTERLLARWSAGAIDILIGTQMVTKGHDVPGVTLVGVVSADLSLNFPDFRAAERTFQLLAQVAGRAGRGDRAGQVIVQTLQPSHFSLLCAAQHDFESFASAELSSRRELGYPPFSRLVLLRVEGERLPSVEQTAGDLAVSVRTSLPRGIDVLGPTPAPLERLRGRHRFQILLRGRRGREVRQLARRAVEAAVSDARRRDVRLLVDVDPYDML